MWETLIIILVVGAAAVLIGRSSYRTLTSEKPKCSGCTGCRCHEKTSTVAKPANHSH